MKQENIEKIISSIENGAEFIEDLANKIGLSIYTVMNYSYEAKIKPPPYKDRMNRPKCNPKKDKKRDRLIKRGLPLTILAEKFNCTRQNMHRYILVTEQHETWKQSRRYFGIKHSKKIKRKEALGVLASQIEEIARRKVLENDRLAYEKTEEFFKMRNRKYSFDKIFSLFKDYYDAKRENKKVSLKKFADKYDFWIPTISVFFKEAGLKTLVAPNRKKRVASPKYKIQALERSISIEMPISDKSYFLVLPHKTVSNFNIKRNGKISEKVNPIKRFGIFRKEILMYGNASQIYEARDAGFTKSEILELIDIDDKVYNYAIRHKKEISGYITSSLKKIFPDKLVKNPYIDFSINS